MIAAASSATCNDRPAADVLLRTARHTGAIDTLRYLRLYLTHLEPAGR